MTLPRHTQCRIYPLGKKGRVLTNVTIRNIRDMLELDELRIAYFRQEQNSLVDVLDLVESSPLLAKNVQQIIVRTRVQIAKVAALLAAVRLEPSVTRH